MSSSKKFFTGWNILVLSLAGLLVLFVVFRYIRSLVKQAPADAQKEPETSPNSSDAGKLIEHFQLIKQVLDDNQVQDSDTLAQLYTSQAAFETANFTSDVYHNNNNMFGMRKAKVRKNTAVGERSGFATYDSLQQSVVDRLLWDQYNSLTYTNDVKAFVKTIYGKGYFEVNAKFKYIDYQNGVMKWASKLNAELGRG